MAAKLTLLNRGAEGAMLTVTMHIEAEGDQLICMDADENILEVKTQMTLCDSQGDLFGIKAENGELVTFTVQP